ncbi:MAG: hypothetical protein LBQ40_02820 [Clostridiales bacterium]|jgi:hypothetical protein|nr:hypothetical protein [Clostridiales bacterium]
MGKQINFLQSQEDMNEFRNFVIESGLKIYDCDRPPIDHSCYKSVTKIDCGEFGNQYRLSIEDIDKILYKPEKHDIYLPLDNQVVEYSTPRIYTKVGEINIVSNGRIWIDKSSYDNPIYKQYMSLCKWIKKKYKFIADTFIYVAPNIEREIACGMVVGAVNEGRLQIVDEEMQRISKNTWLVSCRLIDGEWIDNTDERFYRR